MPASGPERDDGERDLSVGKLALCALGAATAVLVATTLLLALWRPGPAVTAVIGLLGLVGAVTVMGLVSTRMTRAAYGGAPAHDRDPGACGPDDHGPDDHGPDEPGTGATARSD
nr:hypothetical protein [Rhodococcus triatomae]